MPRDAADPNILDVTDTDPGGVALHCSTCHALITHAAARFDANGSHEHVVFNPAGHIFTIRCFTEAPGVIASGGASHQFSWFRGYAWRVALCRHCLSHMGWRFEGEDHPPVFFGPPAFFGLIAANLIVKPDKN